MKRTVLAAVAAALVLTGCGGGDETSATDAVGSPSEAEPTLSDEDYVGDAPEDGDGAFPTEEVEPGDTFEIFLPPGDLGEGHVEITLGEFRTEDSTLTQGNAYIYMPMNIVNVGMGVADIETGLKWQWVGDDGLLETSIGVFSDDPLEPTLAEGQRTEGEDLVDVPTQPGTLTLYGLDKNVTIAVDP